MDDPQTGDNHLFAEKGRQKCQDAALADKLSNLRAIARDVDSVGDRIWERFHQNDKKMHGWLYRQTAEALRELASYPAWKEYDRLIKKVFDRSNHIGGCKS